MRKVERFVCVFGGAGMICFAGEVSLLALVIFSTSWLTASGSNDARDAMSVKSLNVSGSETGGRRFWRAKEGLRKMVEGSKYL